MTSTDPSRPLPRSLPFALALITAGVCAASPPGLTPPPPRATTSEWAYPAPGDPEGRLAYKVRRNGDRLPDFSYAGYGGGGVPLPHAPVRFDLSPLPSGDDGARIQAALDYVGTLPPDAAGVRGAVLLRKGEYRVAGHLRLDRGGVVLRGEGRGRAGTVLRATGDGRRALVQVAGQGRSREVPGTRRRVVDRRVPVGSLEVTVDDARGYALGQRVVVRRPSTQEWIDHLGMDADDRRGGTRYDTSDEPTTRGGAPVRTSLDNPWRPGTKDLAFDRVVRAVRGDVLVLDAPLTTALEQEFGGGEVLQVTFPGRITNVGVESLRGVSDHDGGDDEDHAWTFVSLEGVEDGWVRDFVSVHFAYAAVLAGAGSRRITVQDGRCLDPISRIDGGRRYSFAIDDAQLVLMQRLHARNGRHDFVTGSVTCGPNVFLRCSAESAHSDVGPHHRWASGILFDDLRTDGELNVRERGDMGTGHGWAGASCVVWNARADSMTVGSPPGALNWAIGCQARRRLGDGAWDSAGTPVWPPRLYERQLEERLGSAAVAALAP